MARRPVQLAHGDAARSNASKLHRASVPSGTISFASTSCAVCLSARALRFVRRFKLPKARPLMSAVCSRPPARTPIRDAPHCSSFKPSLDVAFSNSAAAVCFSPSNFWSLNSSPSLFEPRGWKRSCLQLSDQGRALNFAKLGPNCLQAPESVFAAVFCLRTLQRLAELCCQRFRPLEDVELERRKNYHPARLNRVRPHSESQSPVSKYLTVACLGPYPTAGVHVCACVFRRS